MKSLPEGLDLSELSRDKNPQILIIPHNGKAWEFVYTSVSWEDQWQAIEDSWGEGDEVEFNTTTYYSTLLKKAILAVPGGGFLTDQMIANWDGAILTKLTSIIPSPALDREVEEIKKESSLTQTEMVEEDTDRS